jgi:putative DNA methylase
LKHALIEDASVELLELFDEVSKEAKKEKLAKIALNRGIYWWTRKPLVVGRAMTLASTLDNIDDMKSFLGLNSKDHAYKYTPNTTAYSKKLGIEPKKIKILDPFGGAGNLIFPAVELGLDTTISDYNPLAYLIERSVLEFPAKYGIQLAQDVEKYANKVFEETKKECNNFFKENQLTYLWCWCIKCSHCKQRIPLTNQMYIAKSPKKKVGIKIIPKNKDFTVEIIQNISEKEGKEFTQKAGKAKCISCKNAIDYKTMTEDISINKDREMILIQIQKNKGRDFIIPTTEDKKRYQEAIKYFKMKKVEFEKENLIPTENILASHRKLNTLWHYNIKYWNEYFDERQLLVLCTFLKNLKNICNTIEDKEYRSVIALYLAGVLSRRIDMAGFGVQWHTRAEKPEHILAMRQPIVAYNFAESNPFEKIGGSLINNIKSIKNQILFSIKLKNISKCKLESVTSKNNLKHDLILTDPPYGDDVQYGEGSQFFYVWVYRALKDYFTELPSKTPLDEDFCEAWGRFGDKELASEFFGKGLKKSFMSLNEKLKDDGLLVVFFAHSSTQAWNLFLESIRNAKFKVISSYSIHTENASGVLSLGKTSFMSSIVVVCRKILEPSEEYFEDIIPKIEDKIKKMIIDISDEKLITLPITDLLIMVYGKVLEACTQHTVLKSYQKDFTPDFETLIKDARSFIMKELVRKLTGKSMSVIGSRMAFYLLIKIFHRGIIGGDDASKIAKIYDVNIDELEKEEIVIKEKDVIRLYYLNEIEMDYSPDNVDKNNLYQQLCYLAYTVDSRGSDKIPGIISKDNFRVEDLKQIISLLIKNYHLRKNKGESLVEKEQKELKILETLADITGVKVEGILDSFM